MNFALDVVERAPRTRSALIALARDGSRNEISFGEVADRSARLAGTLAARGVGRGDVVMTRLGPGIVFIIHDVAIDTRLGVVGEIRQPFGVVKCKSSQSHRNPHENWNQRQNTWSEHEKALSTPMAFIDRSLLCLAL